jgi:hypothetical protein
MAVDANDPAYRAEIVPSTIKTLGRQCCSHWGVGLTAFGDRGNLQHTSGYHRSRRYNLAHAPGNYSVQLQADRAGDPNWIAAFDFTPAIWGSPANRSSMTIITKRMRAAAKARDPRVAALREFAGTEDGRTVVTIDMQTGGDRAPFDSSHLDHGHGSLFRARAADDHTGIFEVMAGIPAKGGSDMDVNEQIPGLGGLTFGVFLRDMWTDMVVRRGLTLDANGIPQRHSADRWTGPHLLTSQVLALNALTAAGASSAQREQQIIDTLTDLAQSGTSVDTAALSTQIAELGDLLQQLRTENAALRARLAVALGPGSE